MATHSRRDAVFPVPLTHANTFGIQRCRILYGRNTRRMKRLALAAGAKWTSLSQDDALLLAELARLGWSADTMVWNHPQVLWNSYRHVLLRAVLDYHLHP